MSRVILVAPTGQNTESASAYGELCVLCPAGINPLNTPEAEKVIRERLREIEFDPEQDWLIMSGNSIAVALLVGVVVAQYEFAPLLMFNAKEGVYVNRIFEPEFNGESTSNHSSDAPSSIRDATRH